MEWRPVLSFTSLYIPHVPLPPSLEFIVMVPYHSLHLPFGYILFSYCVCQVCQVCTYCVLHGSKLDIFTYLGTYLST